MGWVGGEGTALDDGGEVILISGYVFRFQCVILTQKDPWKHT